jgi:chemotaxis protein MotB
VLPEPEKKPRRRVKKVKGHAAPHGGAWKVAYADFVTAMMALFLVLWLVSQADTKLKQSIASYFRSPGVFTSQAGGVVTGPKKVSKDPSALTSKDDEQALFGMATTLKKKFDTRPEFSKYKDQVKIDITEQGVKIQILDKADRVSFGSGSAALTPDARAILEEIARAICELPNPLLIGGHTDRHLFPPDSVYTNWELSADRANAARRQLESICVKPEQIRRIVGYSDTEPLIPDDPYAVANRRISITVLRISEPAAAPGSDSGKPSETSPNKISTQTGTDKPSGPAPLPQLPAAPKPGGPKSMSIGVPDELPKNVKVTKEPTRAPAPTPKPEE